MSAIMSVVRIVPLSCPHWMRSERRNMACRDGFSLETPALRDIETFRRYEERDWEVSTFHARWYRESQPIHWAGRDLT
jgi:hypothetical protein